MDLIEFIIFVLIDRLINLTGSKAPPATCSQVCSGFCIWAPKALSVTDMHMQRETAYFNESSSSSRRLCSASWDCPSLGVSSPNASSSSVRTKLRAEGLLRCLCATRPLLSRGNPPDRKLGARTGRAVLLLNGPARSGWRGLRSVLSKSSMAAALGEASGSGEASENVARRFSLGEARTRSLYHH